MAMQVMWAACNITHPETGEDHIIHRGALLPDWAFDERLKFMREALVMTGAIQVVDDPAQAEPARVVSEESKQETPKQETPKQETPKQETPKQETPKQTTADTGRK